MYLNQMIGQGGDVVSWVVWLVFFMVFFMFYPRLMLFQIMGKLEASARKLELMSEESRKFVLGTISKKPDKKTKDAVDRFFEFFMIYPVDIDPSGMIKKLDHVIQNERERFTDFANEVAPDATEEKKASIQMGAAGGMELYMVAKIVRHYIEVIKKTKSYQIAMIIQMQLPLIERIAKALEEGTKTLARGEPIGDGIGPWMVARMIDKKNAKETEDEVVVAEKKIDGRHVFLVKAKGPGGRVAYPGKAVEKIMKKHKISRVITIDAAAKLEGEKTGSVAEGVGVAMGGPGVERSYIEDAVVRNRIPLDSVIVKMLSEEAIKPMRMSMLKAEPAVMDSLKRRIAKSKKGEKIIIVGVGNTSGVGNSSKDAADTVKWVAKYEKKMLTKKKKNQDQTA
ncbi:MAG: DUF1512 family protein [Candidatus Aenigmatarchaeota archaeon]